MKELNEYKSAAEYVFDLIHEDPNLSISVWNFVYVVPDGIRISMMLGPYSNAKIIDRVIYYDNMKQLKDFDACIIIEINHMYRELKESMKNECQIQGSPIR